MERKNEQRRKRSKQWEMFHSRYYDYIKEKQGNAEKAIRPAHQTKVEAELATHYRPRGKGREGDTSPDKATDPPISLTGRCTKHMFYICA
jgi:hypothetical protein